ncbi:MAG: hypothetical protein ACI8SE_000865, partial [Bacteroidia bacterium]
VDMADCTGSKTIIRFDDNGRNVFWEPFSDRNIGEPLTRNLYKNRSGNKIIFEEIHGDHGLSFQYMWTFSEKFGFVKRSIISNTKTQSVNIEVLDGVQNVLPYGVNTELQTSKSTLVDAYKKNELDLESGLGIYSLSAMIVDKAEPSESLSCTTVWSIGAPKANRLLSSLQLKDFRLGREIVQEADVRAEKGAYFIHSSITLEPGREQSWFTVCEVNQSASDVVNLRETILHDQRLLSRLQQDIDDSTNELRKLVASADGLQKTSDDLSTGRHYSNVLFNIMRGGVFNDQYLIFTNDFAQHVRIINKLVFDKTTSFLKGLQPSIDVKLFINSIHNHGDSDLLRMANEYLPLFFSRRHGDPSRPWNYFSIETKNNAGEKNNNYEGNWRDIFQNWEALALSFPNFTFGFISKFLNASTIDGYNPYRIYKEGLDWEIADENDPWSYIGYWGDHQIIYLSKLIEVCESHFPDLLTNMMVDDYFVYANVPYKIKEFEAIVANPRDTIAYDYVLDTQIKERVLEIGSDGKLCLHRDSSPVRANLVEKIMVTLCTKLYNFIPDGGIWLNTQRPEWNDANNALVGNGVSMVTLYYMRRFITLVQTIISPKANKKLLLNRPVVRLIDSLLETYEQFVPSMDSGFTDSVRFDFVKQCGEAGEYYRRQAYAGFRAEKETIEITTITSLLSVALRFIDNSIEENKREDKLYHAYNVVAFEDENIKIERLYEMLEGQVAVLSSGYIEPQETGEILDSLKQSKMFRPDQYSYMLYPDRQLPSFLNKNSIHSDNVKKIDLFNTLAADKNKDLIIEDVKGDFHFNGDIHNANDVKAVLKKLSKNKYKELVDVDSDKVLHLFEALFDHKSFTGRSGTFYGYEGLGSIYWHMVSKLLMAVQENIISAYHKGTSKSVLGNLIDHYYEIRAGIGVNKSPHLYGAFPTDAYSHTPGNAGAQQPGMTGQVKEDIINRWSEFGVVINNGAICFEPLLLRSAEFLNTESEFQYYDVNNASQTIQIDAGALAFTYCQVPIVYQKSNTERINIEFYDGRSEVLEGNQLTKGYSSAVYNRTGTIRTIHFNCISLLVK